MKLELKHLAPYLPYGLGLYIENDVTIEPTYEDEPDFILSGVVKMSGLLYEETSFMPQCVIYTRADGEAHGYTQKENIKPILRPLSDLTKEIEHNGEKFVPIRKLLEANSFNLEKMETEYINSFAKSMVEIQMAYDDAQLLLRWHFDIFGLIEKDLAVNINTLSVPE